uniref:Uncharacterized protein n=1 Tax=Rhabditophanes sp. KR3021 TaxID=114890 RepID=A0AC35UFP9_9BILA
MFRQQFVSLLTCGRFYGHLPVENDNRWARQVMKGPLVVGATTPSLTIVEKVPLASTPIPPLIMSQPPPNSVVAVTNIKVKKGKK